MTHQIAAGEQSRSSNSYVLLAFRTLQTIRACCTLVVAYLIWTRNQDCIDALPRKVQLGQLLAAVLMYLGTLILTDRHGTNTCRNTKTCSRHHQCRIVTVTPSMQEAQLPLWLRPYEVLVTSNRTALIELIPDSLSIHTIKAKSPPGTSLRDHFIARHGQVSTPHTMHVSFSAMQHLGIEPATTLPKAVKLGNEPRTIHTTVKLGEGPGTTLSTAVKLGIDPGPHSQQLQKFCSSCYGFRVKCIS